MEGGEDKVAGFRRAEGDQGAVFIADFAEEDHIRALTESSTKGDGEGGRVLSDFALGEVAEVVFEEILHRVLDGHDVAAVVVVDPVEATGDRGGLSAAGGAADDDESTASGEPGHQQGRGQSKVLEVGDRALDGAKHRTESAEGSEEVHPHPGSVRGGPADVLFQIHGRVRADVLPEGGHFLMVERMVFEGDDLAVDADPRRVSSGEDQIGRAFGEGGADVIMNGRH